MQPLLATTDHFPVMSTSVTYLDHASVSPLPRVAIAAMTQALTAVSQRGSLEHPNLHAQADAARATFAELIGCAPADLASVTNTSSGISLVANGLDWRAGDEVVVPEIDFPSVVLPWKALADRSVVTKLVPCRDGLVSIDDLMSACTSRTRVVAVSWVQFSSGFRIDLHDLANRCRQRGVFLIVDAMQGVGALEIDVGAAGIDALAAQSYKWLLGPHGAGWLYLGDRLRNSLSLSGAGARTVTPRESYIDHRFEPRADAGRFETGLLNFYSIIGAHASQKLLNEVGIGNIEARVCALADQLHRELVVRGCDVGARDYGAPRSAIVSFKENGRPPDVCHAHLARNNIVTSFREGRIRVAPHFYNSERDIEHLLRVLDQPANH
jgi:cysteine desulfurase / selenocysteine lyase